MRYLLTGACGFIGTYVLRELMDHRQEVVCFDYHINTSIIEKIFTGDEIDRMTFVQGDVRDLPKLLETCKQYKVERIIHLATLLERPSRNCAEAVKTNIMGTVNIFDAARILGIKKVVWASSQTVFGPQDRHPEEWIPNDGAHYPLTIYAATKAFLENISKNYYETYGLVTIGLRYSITYGYGRPMSGGGGYAGCLINAPAYGIKGIVDYGDDAPNWLYVKDAARATMLACDTTEESVRAYTITGEIQPVKKVKKLVCSLLPEAEITLKPGVFGAGWKFDTTQTKELLGYEPQYSVEDGVRETIRLIQQETGGGTHE